MQMRGDSKAAAFRGYGRDERNGGRVRGESERNGLVLFSWLVFLFAPGVRDPIGETPLQGLGCLFLFYV